MPDPRRVDVVGIRLRDRGERVDLVLAASPAASRRAPRGPTPRPMPGVPRPSASTTHEALVGEPLRLQVSPRRRRPPSGRAARRTGTSAPAAVATRARGRAGTARPCAARACRPACSCTRGRKPAYSWWFTSSATSAPSRCTRDPHAVGVQGTAGHHGRAASRTRRRARPRPEVELGRRAVPAEPHQLDLGDGSSESPTPARRRRRPPSTERTYQRGSPIGLAVDHDPAYVVDVVVSRPPARRGPRSGTPDHGVDPDVVALARAPAWWRRSRGRPTAPAPSPGRGSSPAAPGRRTTTRRPA